MTSATIDLDGIRALLEPESIAVLGASEDPSKVGGRPLQYLLEYGFSGRILPINPRREAVQGLTAFTSIGAVNGSVDMAIIALPATLVLDAVRQCASKGVRACIIFSSGFAEIDEEGGKTQQSITAIAQSSGMRVLGPNCLGAMNLHRRMVASFSGCALGGLPPAGRIGFVSQSGALGSHCFTAFRARNLSFGHWITTGNESDIEFADCLAFLANDPDTDVIAAYIEGCRDGDKLRQALALARRNRKPVVLLKVGESEIGAEAAASHTASLAGSGAVYDAVFDQYGVCRARSLVEFVDLTYACTAGIFPTSRRIGLATISGGVGIIMADKAAELGLDVAPMPESSQVRLKQRWAPAAVRNPVDVTAQVVTDLDLLSEFLEEMLEHGDYAAVTLFLAFGGNPRDFADRVLAAMAPLRQRYEDRLLLISALWPKEIQADFDAAGYLTFDDPGMSVQVASELMSLGQSFAAPTPTGEESLRSSGPQLTGTVLNEATAKRLLAEAGLQVVRETVVNSDDEAAQAAQEMGYPVVMKIVSPDIIHKTEAGGVLLNIESAAQARAGYQRILQQVQQHHPNARVDGVLVAQMIQGGIETLIGIHRDPVFGPVVAFGLGGIFVEILKDVALRLAPISPDEAHRMIREIRGFPVLAGARGHPAADLDAIAKALVDVSHFAWNNRNSLETLDINPFIALPEGKGAFALDALIVNQSGSSSNVGTP